MDIFSVITLLGGLAFFLYGMHVMSSGLEKMTGGRLEQAVDKMTSTPAKGLLLGMGVTVAIQSSSALTVMLVGLVNAGVMQFSQTAFMIMGSNIGTTLTAWILSLAGIDSGSVILQLLKPTSFAPIMAFIGILLIMSSKSTRRKDIGGVFVGFAALMYGMTLMSDAVSPLADMPEFSSILTAFNNPLLGVITGAVFTGIIQSSAASVGILQALSLTGGISWAMAVPIIMGQNIGTCVTSLISSIGVNKSAKRVAAFHVMFNVIGTAICLVAYFLIDSIFGLAAADAPISPVGIAAAHSAFNLLTTGMLLPFTRKLVALVERMVPDSGSSKQDIFIDQRLLATPAFAISECGHLADEMARLAQSTMLSALSLLGEYDAKVASQVREGEDRLDKYEDRLGAYLVQLSSKNLTVADSRQVAKLLLTIGDFERIGDHALNIHDAALEMHDKKLEFTEAAVEDMSVLRSALIEILALTMDSFTLDDASIAGQVEPLEQVIDGLILTSKARHINRLQNGMCTINHGFVLSDVLTNIERTSDHCSNIAVAVIEEESDAPSSHEYLSKIKTMDNEDFREQYNVFSRKYALREE